MCEIGVGFSSAALSVFRLRRAEAASAVWIPHSLPDIRSLSNRKGRGRRSGGREREPRRAGEGSPKPPPKHPPEPRSGLCPELLADFRIPKPPGCSQGGAEGSFPLCLLLCIPCLLWPSPSHSNGAVRQRGRGKLRRKSWLVFHVCPL